MAVLVVPGPAEGPQVVPGHNQGTGPREALVQEGGPPDDQGPVLGIRRSRSGGTGLRTGQGEGGCMLLNCHVIRVLATKLHQSALNHHHHLTFSNLTEFSSTQPA